MEKMPPESESSMDFYKPPYRYDWDTPKWPDAKYLVRISASDKYNTTRQDIKVTVDNIPPDTTPPVVKIISPIDGQVVVATESPDDTVKIIVDATDNQEVQPGSVYCFINEKRNGLTHNPPYQRGWWAHTPGEYTLQAEAKDREGNVGKSSIIRVKVAFPGTDITPPVTQDNYQFNDVWTNQDASITLTARDDITGVKETYYTIDGGTQQTGTNIIITQEGIYTIEYWSVDNIGNIESKHTIIVKIDKTPPVTTATVSPSPNQAGWNNTLPVNVTFSATDNLSGVKTTTPDSQITQGGLHDIRYQSTDNAGNVEPEKTITVSVDITSPDVTISAEPSMLWPVDKKPVKVTINGTATDAGSEISTKVFTVTDEYNEVIVSLTDFGQTIELIPWRTGDDKDGRIYTIKVVVTDKAGNSTTKETIVTVPHDMRDK
jgi:hypothetical protein